MGNRAGLTMKSYEQRKVNNSKHKNTPQLLRVIKEVKESDLGNEISKLVAKEKNRHSGTEWRVETRHNFQSWSHLPKSLPQKRESLGGEIKAVSDSIGGSKGVMPTISGHLGVGTSYCDYYDNELHSNYRNMLQEDNVLKKKREKKEHRR